MNTRQNLRIAGFDGGGARAYSQLKIVDDILLGLRYDLYGEDDERVMLPCEHFDLMGGSDTGGLIVLMFVILKMSVNEARDEFCLIIKEAYAPGLTPAERTQKLKGCIEALLEKKGKPTNLKLEEHKDVRSRCAGFAIAALKDNALTKAVFRSYPLPKGSASAITVVDAVLATCASQPDFEIATFNDGWITRGYVGAGIADINPIRHVLNEAKLKFGGDATVSTILSLGSGHTGVISMPVSGGPDALHQVAQDYMRDAEHKAQVIEAEAGQTGIFFRFSVEQGLQRSETRNTDSLSWIEAQTAAYRDRHDTSERLESCTVSMSTPRAALPLNWLITSISVPLMIPPDLIHS